MDDAPNSKTDHEQDERRAATWTVPAQHPGEIPVKQQLPPPGFGNDWTDRLAARTELIPGIAAIGVFAYWSLSDGGVLATKSYTGGMILLGVLAATAYAYRQRLGELPRLTRWAMALLAGFVFWNFLSITWAGDQGAAWDGANRTLVYLVAFTLFAIPPWRPRNAAILLGAYAGVEAAIAAGSLIAAAGDSNPLDSFIAVRFAAPTNYHNATAALFAGAMFPAIHLASRRETPWLARGLMLAAAGILFDVSLLPQSRGWLLALPLAAAAYIAFVPGRVRSLIVLVPLGAACALTAGPMLDVFDHVLTPGLGAALGDAKSAMLLSAALLFVAGAAIGFADSRIEIPEGPARIGSRVIGAGAAALAVVAAVIALAAVGNPVSWTSDQWQEFKSGEAEHTFNSSRLTQGLGSNRYDFWRVAVDEFKAKPLNGVGTENFAVDYLKDRHTTEEPLHPHSLPLRILAQTGLIGASLLIGFLAVALTVLGRIRFRSPEPLARGVTGVIVVFLVYWLVHSSGDWFWAFPALTAPVFAFLGMGMRVGAAPSPPSTPRKIRQITIAGAVCAGFAAISMLLPWMAATYVGQASKNWPADPSAAFDRLDRARTLNFLSDQPDVVEGTIAVRLGDDARVRSAYEDAVQRNPYNWYARLELAALDALQGNSAAALAGLDKVQELNPREELIGTVRAGIESGHPVTLAQIDKTLGDRVCGRLGRVPSAQGCAP